MGDWACDYHVTGVGMRRPRQAFGVDAFQALILAIESIRRTLDRTDIEFQWVTQVPGDTGFPRYLDSGYGLKLRRRLERLVDKEIRRYGAALARKVKRARWTRRRGKR
jgi:hypothetical protein